jgi:hypothetical protein
MRLISLRPELLEASQGLGQLHLVPVIDDIQRAAAVGTADVNFIDTKCRPTGG